MTMYKFLDENLQGKNGFVYDLPRWDGKSWNASSWVEEKDVEESGSACGKGLHLMKVLNPKYTRYVTCFEAEGIGLLGEDDNKARFRAIRLIRPIRKEEIFKPKANLQGAYLRGAYLQGADLRWADLRGADLRWADLRGADVTKEQISLAKPQEEAKI